MTYNLPITYTARLEPEYFNDVLPDSTAWQADVYRQAAEFARLSEVQTLIDLGCGNGLKLKPFIDEFHVIGVDYGANLDQFVTNIPPLHTEHKFMACDLNAMGLPPSFFVDSVVICADVIEHLPTPDALIETLRCAVQTAEYVLVSTPDRDKLVAAFRDASPNGPPMNRAHVREWSFNELRSWFIAEGLPIVWSGWTISNEQRPDQVWTSMLVLSNKHKVSRLSNRFIAAPRLIQPSGSKLRKVWMTPTYPQAMKDTTNAIHQIVCRMYEHLPQFGYELVENPDVADIKAAHAGQGSRDPIDVAHYHGLYNTAAGHSEGGFFAINAAVIHNLRSAKVVTAPSEWIADVIRRDMHIEPHIIGWGVDTEEWTPGQNQGYVIWNKARVDAISDPAPMLALAARVPEVPFLTTFGVGGSNVHTLGRQSYETMKSYVRKAAVYLATVTETFGIATVEAMAAGVPILGFRHGNTAHLVEHGVTGFLAEPGDIDGLLEGLAYCLKYRDRLGRNAREAAKYYTWERVAQGFAAVYDKVLQPYPFREEKVSVVIPCHNYAEYVGEAIESALNQTTSFKYEVIVVLDNCTDNSAEVVTRYGERGIKAFSVQNGSLSKTRNDGIHFAHGEYIVLLDADDRLGSDRFLQTLADELDHDRTLGIAFTGITVMDAAGGQMRLNPWPNGYDFDQQAQRRNQVPSCCMFRKEAWARAGGFRPWFKYAEDAEFWLTVGSLGYKAKHVVRDGWFHYRLHSKSASQVHRTGEVKEPDWTEFHPWTKDGQRPFAADGQPPSASWPVRFYLKPDVTIIIPVGKDHIETIGDTLHSVEGQTHRFWECIVVNDTGKPLDLMGFPWAKVVSPSGGKLGAGAARNLGAKHSNAPMLVFLDADDILKPKFLERALATYQRHGRYAYSDWMTDDRRGNVKVYPTPEYGIEAFRQNLSIHPITALIPRTWFEQVGGFDENLPAYEDVDLFLNLLTHGFCGMRIPEPLLVYNLDAGSRRKSHQPFESDFLSQLKNRYREFMEERVMCDCVDPPKGKKPLAPTPENLAEYRDTYGDSVEVRLVSEFAGISPTTFRGPATRVNYGYRARGDVFFVWEADVLNSQGVFEVVENFEVVPQPTIVPPPPPDLTPPEPKTDVPQSVELTDAEVDALEDVGLSPEEIEQFEAELVADTPVRKPAAKAKPARRKSASKRKTS